MKRLLFCLLLIPSFAYADSIAGTWKGRFRLVSTTCSAQFTSDILTGAEINRIKTYRIRKLGGIFIKTNTPTRYYYPYGKSQCATDPQTSFTLPGGTLIATVSECVRASSTTLSSVKGMTIDAYGNDGSYAQCQIVISGRLLKQ